MKMRVGSTLRKVLHEALVLRAVGVTLGASIEFMVSEEFRLEVAADATVEEWKVPQVGSAFVR